MVGGFNGVPYSARGVSVIKFRPRTANVYYQKDYYTEGDIMASIPGLDQAVGGFRHYYRCAVDPTYPCPPVEGAGGLGPDARTAPLAGAFGLAQNAPNPFNPSTDISFTVPAGGAPVTLQIFDVSGRLVRTLVDGFEAGGARTVTWHGRSDDGRPAPSGVYFYRLTAPSFSEQKRMTLLK
jgi:hypothetical protein